MEKTKSEYKRSKNIRILCIRIRPLIARISHDLTLVVVAILNVEVYHINI
jgi:hypothetical protein